MARLAAQGRDLASAAAGSATEYRSSAAGFGHAPSEATDASIRWTNPANIHQWYSIGY